MRGRPATLTVRIMSQSSNLPWVHIGECPVCGDGLCRVRCCRAEASRAGLFALCDECEAIWLEPSTSSEHQFIDSQEPRCPLCHKPLYDEHCRWALPEDLLGTPWASESIINLPNLPEQIGTEPTLVTDEDEAGGLDVPPLTQPLGDRAGNESSQSRADDWAYGQDEPRPGC